MTGMAAHSSPEMESKGAVFDHVDQPMKFDSESGHDVVGTPHEDDFGFTPEEQRSILSRVDRRLVITVGAMYCVSLMDRTNMSAANIAGMSVELNLIKNRYVGRSFLQISLASWRYFRDGLSL